jgi:hypothetical protein
VTVSHLGLLVAFSFLVSIVLALLHRGDGRERLRFGLEAFGAFVLATVAVAWLMWLFPA